MNVAIRALDRKELVAIVSKHMVDLVTKCPETAETVELMLTGAEMLPLNWAETELVSYIDKNGLPADYCSLMHYERLEICWETR